MSLKCSLFGCNWGEADVEREREEDGSEVIITIRETETCKRCGDSRVVSENKEVTTLETAADIVADDLEDDAAAGDDPPSDAGRGPPETEAGESPPEESGGTTIPDAESDAVVTTEADAAGTAGTGGSPPDDIEDDAVILDDSDDEASGGETVDAGAGDDGPSDESDGSTGAAVDAEPDDPWEQADSREFEGDEGAEIVGGRDTADTGDDDGERQPGEWPEEPENDDGWEQPTDIDRSREEEPSGFGTVGNAVTVPEGEFYCPECEYTTSVESSSLRAGDYCPECHRGSLEHRSD